jgi:hypothetical protein
MSEELNAIDWLVIACALALGFGVIKFLIVARNDREAPPGADAPRARHEGAREEGVDDDRTG